MPPKQPHEFSFKIIAGSLKGRVITAPDLGVTRPPLSRLRKSIFDFLQPHISDRTYLDLFSGTGAYLFEALSRGAVRTVGVEIEGVLVRAVESNAKRLGVADRLSCMGTDVFEAIPKLAREDLKFDIIMIAPPQYRRLVDKALVLVKQYDIINSGGLIVCQHDSRSSDQPAFSGFQLLQRRKYGHTTFTVFVAQ